MAVSLPCCIRMLTDVSDSPISDSSQSCHELSEASEEELEVVTEFQPYSDEPLADDDADYVGEDEADQDGLTPEILEARYERRLTVREW